MKLSFDQNSRAKTNPDETKKPRKKFANIFSGKKEAPAKNTANRSGPTIESHGFDYSDTVAPRIVTTDTEQQDATLDVDKAEGTDDDGLDFFDYDEPDASTTDSTIDNDTGNATSTATDTATDTATKTIDTADNIDDISEQDASNPAQHDNAQNASTGRNKLFIYGVVAGILLALGLSVMFFKISNGDNDTPVAAKGSTSEPIAESNTQTDSDIDSKINRPKDTAASNEAGMTASQPTNNEEGNTNKSTTVESSASQDDEFAESAKAVVDAETQAAIDAALGKNNPADADVMNQENAAALDNTAVNASNQINDNNATNAENPANDNLYSSNTNSDAANNGTSYEAFVEASETPIKIVKKPR